MHQNLPLKGIEAMDNKRNEPAKITVPNHFWGTDQRQQKVLTGDWLEFECKWLELLFYSYISFNMIQPSCSELVLLLSKSNIPQEMAQFRLKLGKDVKIV